MDQISEKNQEPVDEHTDVVILCENGDTYVAAFFTLDHIQRLMEAFHQDGNYLKGKYFWAKNMVVIEKCDRKEIEMVIEDLLEEGDFLSVFEKL